MVVNHGHDVAEPRCINFTIYFAIYWTRLCVICAVQGIVINACIARIAWTIIYQIRKNATKTDSNGVYWSIYRYLELESRKPN